MLLLRPVRQAQHVRGGNIVAGGVIGVDEHQVVDVLGAEEGHQVVSGVPEVRARRGEADVGPVLIAVGVLLEGGADEAGDPLQPGHQGLDELRRAVAHQDVLLVDGEVPGRQQGVHPHAGGILVSREVKLAWISSISRWGGK